jgi:hypothetical protein
MRVCRWVAILIVILGGCIKYQQNYILPDGIMALLTIEMAPKVNVDSMQSLVPVCGLVGVKEVPLYRCPYCRIVCCHNEIAMEYCLSEMMCVLGGTCSGILMFLHKQYAVEPNSQFMLHYLQYTDVSTVTLLRPHGYFVYCQM